MQAGHDGLTGQRPLPTAVLTGLAFLADPGAARKAYEGSDHGGPMGEGREACLARLYPDYATLVADTGFASSTRRLYAPYREWLDAHVRVDALANRAAAVAEGSEPGDD